MNKKGTGRNRPYATSTYFPLGKNFVCKKFNNTFKKTKIILKILDNSFNEIKDLEAFEFENNYISPNNKKNLVVIRDFFGYTVEGEKLFVGNTQKGFHFTIFDTNGNKLYEISRPYEKIPITSKHKQEEMKELLKTVGKTRYERSKKKYNYLYPEFFPAYSNFTVDENKIYVLTYPKIDGQKKMLVLDQKGNLLNSLMVPTREYNENFCIYKNKYYYIFDNNESEKWEIHVIKINDLGTGR